MIFASDDADISKNKFILHCFVICCCDLYRVSASIRLTKLTPLMTRPAFTSATGYPQQPISHSETKFFKICNPGWQAALSDGITGSLCRKFTSTYHISFVFSVRIICYKNYFSCFNILDKKAFSLCCVWK